MQGGTERIYTFSVEKIRDLMSYANDWDKLNGV